MSRLSIPTHLFGRKLGEYSGQDLLWSFVPLNEYSFVLNPIIK